MPRERTVSTLQSLILNPSKKVQKVSSLIIRKKQKKQNYSNPSATAELTDPNQNQKESKYKTSFKVSALAS